MGGAEQLPSWRDLDLSLTEAPDDGTDAGNQRHVDHHSGLAATEKREPAAGSQMAAGDQVPDPETRRDLHVVGAREVVLYI